MPSFIAAFNQIRLSGSMVSTTPDGRIRVGTNNGMVVSDSGAFTSIAVVNGMGTNISGNMSSTGAALGARIDTVTTNLVSTGGILVSLVGGLSGQTALDFATKTSLTTTGQTLTNNLVGLSGVMNSSFVKSINATGFNVIVATGLDYQQVVYPFTFSAAPKVQLTMECSTQNIFYFCGVSSRTTTGFMALYSDVVLETGISLNIFASI